MNRLLAKTNTLSNGNPFIMNFKLRDNADLNSTLSNQVTNTHLIYPIITTKRSPGSIKGTILIIFALVFCTSICLQPPSILAHFHKDGVLHSIGIEHHDSGKKTKYFSPYFFILAWDNSYHALSINIRSSKLIDVLEVHSLYSINCYSSEHKCRDDLLINPSDLVGIHLGILNKLFLYQV